MSSTHYLQVLLLIAHKEKPPHPGDTALPLIRSKIVKYALIPREHHYDALCKCFLENGITVLQTDELSPFLTNAAKSESIEVMEMVIRVGVRPLDSFGNLIVNVALSDEAVLPVLLNKYIFDESLGIFGLGPGAFPDETILVLEEETNIQIFKTLAALNPNIGQRHRDGGSALHFAVRRRYKSLLNILLESGANVNARTISGLTPLHLAADDNCALSNDLGIQLILFGADVNAASSEALTPLHVALEKWFKRDLIKELIANGASLDAVSSRGSVLELAAKAGPSEYLPIVLSHGPDLDLASNQVAFRAIYKRKGTRKEHVKLLFEYGFKLEPSDAQDVKYLLAAVRLGSREMMENLLRWGAIVHSKNEVGPVDVMKDLMFEAIASFESDALELLLDLDHPRPGKFYGTLLEKAVSSKCRDIVETVLRNGDLSLSSIFDSRAFAILEREEEYDEYDEDNEMGDGDSKSCLRECICKHAALVTVANLRINQEFLLRGEHFGKDELPGFVLDAFRPSLLQECSEEIALMKARYLGGTGVTFYDFVNASSSETVRFLRNKTVSETLSSESYKGTFPHYSSLIESRFRKANYRKPLIAPGIKAFRFLSRHFKLPDEINEQIVQLLCNHELLILNSLCSVPPDDSIGSPSTQDVSQSTANLDISDPHEQEI